VVGYYPHLGNLGRQIVPKFPLGREIKEVLNVLPLSPAHG